MDLQDASSRARFLIRDRDGKYPALFDAILADTGIQVILAGVHMPRMNAFIHLNIRRHDHLAGLLHEYELAA